MAIDPNGGNGVSARGEWEIVSLRTKLIIILNAIVIIGALAASSIIYSIASKELEKRAKHRLTGAAVLVAESVQTLLDADLRKIEYWAAMPLVTNTALAYERPGAREAFNRYFSAVVKQEPYSSIYLIHRNGECIASDDSRRVNHPYVPNVVVKQPDALLGFSGKANIGRSKLSLASGQPIVVLTAPVRHQGEVKAILRTGVDMGRLSRRIIKSLDLAPREKAYIFDPGLPKALPEGVKLQVPTSRKPYILPPEALRAAFAETNGPVFRHREKGEEFLAAAAVMRSPQWVILVSQPMSEVIRPVQALGKATLAVMAPACCLMAFFIRLLTGPVVRGIEQCRRFAAEIRRGQLDRRLAFQSGDEVGALARDLNRMAARIQSAYQALEEAERKYRGIFENAVEGICQTDEAGTILAANPRLAELVGAFSVQDLVGGSAIPFYGNRAQRDRLLSRLRAEGEVSGFECEIIRRDGVRRRVVLHARTDPGCRGGRLDLIHCSLEDVTELRKTEERARQAREAEEQLLRTELEMLRYQINPHFLFNTLNSIRELMLTDPEQGVEMIEALAAFYHACLARRSRLLATVAEEFDRIRMYMGIEKCRFGPGLLVSMAAEPKAGGVALPVFILQPLVENAVKFGRKSGANPLDIRVNASVSGGKCTVTVANTGRWFRPGKIRDPKGEGLGTEYVKRCLAHHYGEAAGFDIGGDGRRVTARLVIPAGEVPGHG